MNADLMLRNDAALSVTFTESAIALRDSALDASALIGRVTNPPENDQAVQAQIQLVAVRNEVEKARKKIKEPILAYSRAIDDAPKAFLKEVNEELGRVSTLIGDFQELERKRQQAALQAENERLMKLERERAAEVAKAATVEQMDSIQQSYDLRMKQEALPLVAPVKAVGQVLRNGWEIIVTDIWALARAHPGCVRIEPLTGQIKALLDDGVKVAGVSAKRITNASVRVGRAIDI